MPKQPNFVALIALAMSPGECCEETRELDGRQEPCPYPQTYSARIDGKHKRVCTGHAQQIAERYHLNVRGLSTFEPAEICICGAPSKDGVCSVPGCVASSNAARQECTDCGTINTPGAALCEGCRSTNLRPLAGLFVAVHKAVMRGADCVAVATSKTFAKRIAAALNNHKPNREGV